ncbi:tetratricopeptide repeat protein [Devosia albogilva]|uniref:Tetratricopeptide repeat protein n=1 Tax=Devosia albogilva TaxID=429726 RepID=A0ABW5QH72_9HYPH
MRTAPDEAPGQETVLEALEQLLAWPDIARSPQLARFLEYIVRRTIVGDAESIKAYSIAVDVLGRPSDFDPQTDPIVRVQARRLRALLDEYYRGPGRVSRVRIALPTGRYVPQFTWAPDEEPTETDTVPEAKEPEAIPGGRRTGRFLLTWLGLAALAVGLGLVAYLIADLRLVEGLSRDRSDPLGRPQLTVMEFQNLRGEGAGGPLSAGLAIELVTDLQQFGTIDARYRPTGEDDDGGDGGLVLTGIVRPDGAVAQYSAILTDSRSAEVVWNLTVPISGREARDPMVLDIVSRRLSLTLGSPRGPLHAEARRLLARESAEGRESPYLCRVLFDIYRETMAGSDAARASACFGALSEAERSEPMVLAAMASLTAEYASPEVSPLETEADRVRLAADLLERALRLDATNAFVWQQRGWLRERTGDLEGALADYKSALQLNPADGDALAANARALAFAGRVVEAEPTATGSVRMTPDPPAWYFGAPALIELRRGANALALRYAEAYVPADRELGPIIAILAGRGVGSSTAVDRYLPQVLEWPAFRAEGVLPRLRQRISDETLLEQIRSGLLAAGVPAAALEEPF